MQGLHRAVALQLSLDRICHAIVSLLKSHGHSLCSSRVKWSRFRGIFGFRTNNDDLPQVGDLDVIS